MELGVWLTYWDLERGLERVAEAPSSGVEPIFLFSAALTSEASVVLVEDASRARATVRELSDNEKPVWLTIVNDVHALEGGGKPTLKDGALVHRILSDASLAARHRDAVVSLAAELGVTGIDIDYENLEPADRERFTDFIASLSSSLRRRDIGLSVTLQPKTRESRSVGPGAADWGALCPFVDRLQVMLYNEHSGKTAPGPMATRAWATRVLEYALGQCEPSRVVPVLKVSGMAWSPRGTRSLHYEEAAALAEEHGVTLSRVPGDEVPYFTYPSKDGPTTVYFEDATSLEVKMHVLRDLGFDKALLWSVGREDPAILPRLLPSAR